MYHFSWFQLLTGPLHLLAVSTGASHDDAIRVLTSWGVCLFLVVVALGARAGLNKAMGQQGSDRFVPASNLGLRNLFEMYTTAILNMLDSVLSKKDAVNYYWLLGGLFLYVFVSNLMSVMPGFLPATDNINTNLAMGLVVLVVYVVAGIARQGMGFFKHMMGPVLALAPLIFLIEALGVFLIRPGSLALRLFGNINGDHTVFGIMSDLIPVVLPSVFLGLGIWVSFLQAFVFTLLSAIYIALSVDHGDDHH